MYSIAFLIVGMSVVSPPTDNAWIMLASFFLSGVFATLAINRFHSHRDKP